MRPSTLNGINVDMETTVVIARPRAVVSAYAADPSNAPHWYVNIDSVEWKTPPPLQVGSQVEFVARFLGRTLRYTYEFAELISGERLVMRTQQGPFPMETTYTLGYRVRRLNAHDTAQSRRTSGVLQGAGPRSSSPPRAAPTAKTSPP